MTLGRREGARTSEGLAIGKVIGEFRAQLFRQVPFEGKEAGEKGSPSGVTAKARAQAAQGQGCMNAQGVVGHRACGSHGVDREGLCSPPRGPGLFLLAQAAEGSHCTFQGGPQPQGQSPRVVLQLSL